MRVSEDTYQKIAENTPDAIMIVQDGAVKYANPAAVALSGYTLQALLQMRFSDLVHADDRDRIADRRQQSTRSGQEPIHRSFRMVDTEGAIRWIENTDVPIEWEGYPATLNTLRDVTLPRNLEQQSIQTGKMEAVGTLAGGIAHDFNNILNVISGHTQLMMLDRAPDDPDISRLKEIELATGKAGDLIRQIMTFSPRYESQLKPVHLNQEVKRITDSLKPRLADITVECRLEEGLETILADPFQIEQALMNLAFNAQTAMPEGGNLRFATSLTVLDSAFCESHLGSRPGTYIRLEISDTGSGMDRETLNRMFEPFFSTAKRGQHKGLGLAIVYGIVKNHNGYIICESAPGEGTAFDLYFPLSDNSTLKKPITETEKPQLPHGSETVLLVDDDQHVLEIGREMLERFGYTVITADCGEIAMTTLAGHVGHIDLVILDVNMPGMGGMGCLRKMLSKNPAMRIIMASGYSPDGAVKRSLDSGACGFVGKPFQVAEMMHKVRDALDI